GHDDGVNRWIWSFASAPLPVSIEGPLPGQSVLVPGIGAGDRIQALLDPDGVLTSVSVGRAGGGVEVVPLPPAVSVSARRTAGASGIGFARPLDQQWAAETGQCRAGVGP
ncbi:MAG: hypothetical protein MUF14_01780, partial [Hyphomonadaceae bacterium]|nr:hypothetical protein [Hyphomonadaceae bacterium]